MYEVLTKEILQTKNPKDLSLKTYQVIVDFKIDEYSSVSQEFFSFSQRRLTTYL